MAFLRRRGFTDVAGFRPKHYCGGRASPPPSPNLLVPRHQAWDLGRIMGLGHGIEQLSAVPKKPARPRQKCAGRIETCCGSILPDALVVSEGFPLGIIVPMGIPYVQ